MLDRNNLQKTLRTVEIEIDLYDLAKQLNVRGDDILIFIQDDIIPEFKKLFRSVAFKMPFWKKEKIEEFFKQQIVDLGLLCQHKIKAIRTSMENQHNTFAHQVFYNNWIMYRGY